MLEIFIVKIENILVTNNNATLQTSPFPVNMYLYFKQFQVKEPVKDSI